MRGVTRLLILLALLVGTPALAIPSAPSHEVPFGTGSVISSAADEAYSVYTADLDGDGDLDVLSASGLDDKIAWYENSGGSPPLSLPTPSPPLPMLPSERHSHNNVLER